MIRLFLKQKVFKHYYRLVSINVLKYVREYEKSPPKKN